MERQRPFIDCLEQMREVKTCVQLYSGGLDSRYFLKVAAETGISVVAVRVLLGAEDPEEVAAAEHAARQAGADYIQIDGKTQFADEFISSAILFNAQYGNQYPVCSSLSRPLIHAGNDDVHFALGFPGYVLS